MNTLIRLAAAHVTSFYLTTRTSLPVPGLYLTTFLLFLTQFFLTTIYNVVLYPRFLSPLRHIPQPPGSHWLTGHTRKIMREPSGFPAREWVKSVESKGGLIRYSNWGRERVVPCTPAALAEVLVTKNYDFVKPDQLKHGLGRILGRGILLTEGEEHKFQRKNLSPAFAFRHIKEIYPVFWKKSQELAACLAVASKVEAGDAPVKDGDAKDEEHKHAPGTINVGNWSSRATLDIIGLSGMGQDFNSLADPSNKLSQTYANVLRLPPGNILTKILQFAPMFLPHWLLAALPIKRNADLNEATTVIKQTCRDLIASKRALLEKSEKSDDTSNRDILSVALQSNAFDDENLVNQLMTFLVAGHETTATSMIWAIYALCKYPDIQTKLREAIRKSIPSLDSDITAQDIDDCHYLQAFCQEVLRLWPPVSLTLRIAGRDTVIQDQVLPKGTTVLLVPVAVNVSEELWGSDAMEFNPSRWLNADGKCNASGSAKSNYSFLTFLHGPRSCIGQKFAVAEFACLLAAWIGKFNTTFEEGCPHAEGEVQIKGGITAKPAGGLWCNVEEVEGW
ncbi:unnamed protein product [Zymoseptoria tritici ST99CH_3D7]|uniref:Cytochrome P450 monooxygenase n=1 Tax=Zymoseptoria tritici (strain ST99CH_3D7) TaxID=1276538 RepID=A0A1X7RF05_ZYMT9|nr:unnamed protein product [Zymoseptoria tritici ST99CH_3D7]